MAQSLRIHLLTLFAAANSSDACVGLGTCTIIPSTRYQSRSGLHSPSQYEVGHRLYCINKACTDLHRDQCDAKRAHPDWSAITHSIPRPWKGKPMYITYTAPPIRREIFSLRQAGFVDSELSDSSGEPESTWGSLIGVRACSLSNEQGEREDCCSNERHRSWRLGR